MIFEVLVFRRKTKTSKPFSGRFNTPVANPVQLQPNCAGTGLQPVPERLCTEK
jgi:hypothetical protein